MSPIADIWPWKSFLRPGKGCWVVLPIQVFGGGTLVTGLEEEGTFERT